MFNLKKYLLIKKANYEGIQGYWIAQTRAWQNCIKCGLQDKLSPQKTWLKCLKEYQEGNGTFDWIARYATSSLSKIYKLAENIQNIQDYKKEIFEKRKQGKTIGQAVIEILNDNLNKNTKN